MCYKERHEHWLLVNCCCRIYFCLTCRCNANDYIPAQASHLSQSIYGRSVLNGPMSEQDIEDLEMTELNNQSVSWSHFQFPALTQQQQPRPAISTQIFVY